MSTLAVEPTLIPQPKTDLMTIRVYNTLSKQKEPFQTVKPGQVGIYLCGPTVYKEAHIGHMIGPVIFDTIKRYLTYCGYDVTLVVNITDVDDKLIAQSHERGISMSQVATEMTMDYCANLLAMGVDQITHMPRATENMDEIIRFMEELVAGGHAYQADGDVFFDVARDAKYGKLSKRREAGEIDAGGNTLLGEVKQLRTNFLSRMDDDFNSGGAVSELFQLLGVLNKFADQHKLEEANRAVADLTEFCRAVETLRELSALLGLFLKPPAVTTGGEDTLADDLMQLLIELRATARKNKDFAASDRIRDSLAAIAVTLEDRKEGTSWRRGS